MTEVAEQKQVLNLLFTVADIDAIADMARRGKDHFQISAALEVRQNRLIPVDAVRRAVRDARRCGLLP